ncbi:MAG: hypothetical protein AB8U88_03340 [Rickettsia conorii subsp. raoultii]|uniref:Uncharacterized protein n=1 Tax=Rickettsia conorii subsp. raoultii TaxID=369822 RepID=A0ABY4U3J4_RICCR|nr:hypothetical protein [Rickettsia conorii]URW78447.1 hypothetical protein NBT09_02960 [Rickettsia conorii subsp. raoultii]
MEKSKESVSRGAERIHTNT